MSHRCGSLCAWRAGSMVPMRTAMLVRAVVHVPDWPSVRLGGLAAVGWARLAAVRLGGLAAVRLGGTGRPFGWAGLAAVRRA